MCVSLLALLFALISPHTATAQPNDNRVAAGTMVRSQLHVSLNARQSFWQPDGDGGAAIPMQAFSEEGKAPQIPGPLIRVREGTEVIASVRNSIPGTTLALHGMLEHPAIIDRAVRIPYGQTRTIHFYAGAPGTYFYWGTTTGKPLTDRWGFDSQLSGAFIVDPRGSATPNDRIFVINQWINVRDKHGQPNFNYELDAINGRTWPHTERLSYAQNSTIHWRVINPAPGTHPLHLHGFFFTVDSRGNGLVSNAYHDPAPVHQVTELVEPGSTFAMTWHADRPGNWFFHCHLAYHIIGHMPISEMLVHKKLISDETYENSYVRHAGMGGLILAFTVRKADENDPVAQSPIARRISLRVEPGPDDRSDAPSFRYVVDGKYGGGVHDAIGPPIVLTRGVSTAIEVTNLLKEPTSVHWHGVELPDSYYDGVVGYSGYGDRVAPMIMPGQTFEARVTAPRSGTFIYHTHMDDVWQLRGGLAGPLIVLDPGATYDPGSDHVFTLTTTHAFADALKIFVNGTFTPAAITCHVGTLQRFRFINMTTFWTNAFVSLSDGHRTASWRPLAVDGADVALGHRSPESALHFLTIGETRDFTFMPTKAGELQLQFWPDPAVPNIVTVPVHVVR